MLHKPLVLIICFDLLILFRQCYTLNQLTLGGCPRKLFADFVPEAADSSDWEIWSSLRQLSLFGRNPFSGVEHHAVAKHLHSAIQAFQTTLTVLLTINQDVFLVFFSSGTKDLIGSVSVKTKAQMWG